jgi:hypothetical protein
MSTCRALAAVAVTLVLSAAVPAGAGGGGGAVGPLRMNEIQLIGTHNSYHRELSGPERAAHDAVYGGLAGCTRTRCCASASVPGR